MPNPDQDKDLMALLVKAMWEVSGHLRAMAAEQQETTKLLQVIAAAAQRAYPQSGPGRRK